MKKRKKIKELQFPILLTDILLGLSVSVYILYPGLRGYAGIRHAKYALFCFLFGGYLAFMLLLGAESLLLGRFRFPSPKRLWSALSVVQKLVLGYWGMTVISTICSPNRSDAWLGMTRDEGLLTISIYCACFLCVSAFARPKPWLIAVFGGTMTVFCVICLWQLCGGNPLGLYPAETNYYGAGVDYSGEYLGTIGNADLTAALLCMAIAVFWGVLWKGRNSQRFWLLIPAVLCLVTVLLSKVQAGLLAVFLGVLLTIPIVCTNDKVRQKHMTLLSATILLLVPLCIYNSGAASGTIYELKQILHGDWQDAFGSGRIGIWRNVLALMPNHLWFGAGPDTMRAASIVWGYQKVNGTQVGILIDVAHNEYLNILYHQGIFALLFYLSAIAVLLLQWIKRGTRSVTAAACGSAILFYTIQALFGFSMCATASIYWLTLALLNNALHKEEVTI